MKKRETKSKFNCVIFTLLVTVCFMAAGCGQKKEIVFWNPFTGSDGEIIQALVDEFNATEPEYMIKNVPLAGEDMYTKIPTVIQSGKNMPDMGVIHYYRIPNYVAQNIIAPMDNILAAQPEIKEENYLPDAWDYGEIDGTRYALPLDLNGVVGYYNVDLLNKYGPAALDDGKITLEEVYEMGEAAKADGIYAYGGAAFTGDQFFSFVGQLGGDLVKDGKPNIDSPETREAIEIMKELYASGYSTVIGDDNYSLFSSGKVIFTPEGTWTVTSWKNDYPELNYAVAPELVVGDVPYNFMSSHQFVVFNNEKSKEKEEITTAKQAVISDFLEFIRTHSDQWAEAGHVPASLAAAESQDFLDMPQSVLVQDEETRDSLKMIKFDDWGYVQDACNGVLEDILLGNLDMDEGLAKAQKEAEDKIAE